MPESIDLLSPLEEDEVVAVEVTTKERPFKTAFNYRYIEDYKIVSGHELKGIYVTDTLDSSPFVDRRLGNFSIPLEWVEGMATKHAMEVFKHFRVLRAELDYVTNSIQYVAASDYFDPVPKGATPGSYDIKIDPGVTPEAPITIRVSRVG